MISMGIIGEYVARIFEEVKGRPLYLVKRDLRRRPAGAASVSGPRHGRRG